jgi:formylglycine-generating enzyme required for sulfatase activity
MDKKGRYHANFGRILDQNGLMIKTLAEDRFLFTSPVGSFKPNQTGLNDMAGNVSEWVVDVSVPYDWEWYPKEYHPFSFFSKIKKNNSRRAFTLAFKILSEQGLIEDSIFKSNKDLINEYLNERIQFEETIKNNDLARVVKGGSWADGSLYMIPFVDTLYKEDASSAKIGFRVAMDSIGSPSRKNYKRKNKRIR